MMLASPVSRSHSRAGALLGAPGREPLGYRAAPVSRRLPRFTQGRHELRD